jgi:biopolymer transport protein ExbB/TolQ
MLLLVPASVVSVACALRCAWLFRGTNVQSTAQQLHPALSPADRACTAVLQLYATLQPLTAMYVLAPLIGMLGSLTSLIPLQARLLSPGARDLEALTHTYQQALIPTFWGVAIAAFSYAAFALLRARLFRAEQELQQ